MAFQKAAEAIDAVWRIESARLIAGLARLVGDVGIAEDLARTPSSSRWSNGRRRACRTIRRVAHATAKHRAIDLLRRRKMQDQKHEHVPASSTRSKSVRTPISRRDR